MNRAAGIVSTLAFFVAFGCGGGEGDGNRDSGSTPPGETSSGEPGAMTLPVQPRILVAHRGASAYAPEHTLAAYRLAIEQGADYIEPDLQITGNGVLIALHDETLERTTNVADVYPDRFREEMDRDGELVRRWYAVDFTLTELRRLDAGSWFSSDFARARIPTLEEVIELALEAGVGIFPETKAPEVYGSLGFDMEGLLMGVLARNGLDRPGAVPRTPVIIQSFSSESLRILRQELETPLSLTFLVGGSDGERWLTAEGLAEVATFADGIGPTKSLVLDDPGVVERAHSLGLTVIPYTFRSDRPGEAPVGAAPDGAFPDGASEMSYFLYEIGVDGLFTNNPDHFPEAPASGGP